MTKAAQPYKKTSLEQFTPEAQEAIRNRAITGNWELNRLIKVLGELAHFDEVNEKATGRALGWTIGFFVMAFLSIFAGAILGEVFNTNLFWLLLPTFIGLGIYRLIQYRKLKKMDLINDFRICLRPALKDLANDIDREQKIKVQMDLSGPVDAKKKSKMEIPPGSYIKVEETIYEDPWCEVRLPLVDGTTAVVQFEVMWHKFDVKKRGRRGKIKWKTKWHKECTAKATLLPPESIQWKEDSLRERADSRLEKVKMVDKDGVTCARLERYWKFKGSGDVPTDAPPSREVVGLLLRLHSSMVPPEVRS